MSAAKLITECLGTMFLVLTILLAAADKTGVGAMAPIAIGAALVALVYMGASVSGAHYNPAVTLAILLRGRIGAAPAAAYVVAQFLGAAAACAAFKAFGLKPWAPAPGAEALPLAVWGIEILFTFLLVLVILNVATCRKTEGNGFYAVVIGLTVVAAAFVGGGISGAALNPAVGIVPNLMLSADGAKHLVLYAAAPSLGAVLATLVYRIQHGSEA